MTVGDSFSQARKRFGLAWSSGKRRKEEIRLAGTVRARNMSRLDDDIDFQESRTDMGNWKRKGFLTNWKHRTSRPDRIICQLGKRPQRAYTRHSTVANLWANRLNGDSLRPESERFTRSNLDRIQTDPTSDSSYGRVPGGKTRPVYHQIPPLMKSGLFGPVRIITPGD